MKKQIYDLQAHLAPKCYLKMLEKRTKTPFVTKDGDAYIFHYGNNSLYNISFNSYDIQSKISAMDKAGIELQLLSMIIPGAEILDVATGNKIASLINDELAEVIDLYPGRFLALATLSYRDVDASLKELDRVIAKYDFRGILLFSNIQGKPLSDKSLWPIYETMQELGLPIFLHPTRPVMVDEVKEYNLEPIVGYMFDTTLAVLKMVFSGVFEKFPDLKLVLPHAGSAIPSLLGRVDYQSSIIPGSRKDISMEPSYYIKKIYTDTVCMSEKTLMSAYELFGHAKLLFATDFPYWEMEPTIKLVDKLNISEEHKQNIYSNNAKRLLRINH